MVDVDNSGEIDFSEFVTATVNRGALLQDDKLRQAFRFYDKDDSGTISISEIKDVLGVGKSIEDHVWDQVVKEVDKDGNGEVDYDEFKTMMVKLLRDDHGNNNTMSKYAEMEKELAARQQAAAS